MADQGQTGPRKARGEGEARDTRRMVLKRERVLVLPEGIPNEAVKAAQDVIRKANKAVGSGLSTLAWVEMGEHSGAAKQAAIEAYAGKPNTPDAKPGEYKAPGMTAWKGGRRYVKPPETKIEAEDIE